MILTSSINNYFDQKKLPDTFEYQKETYTDGLSPAKSNSLELPSDIGDILLKKSFDSAVPPQPLSPRKNLLLSSLPLKKFATAESLPLDRKRIWILKSSILEANSQLTKSLKTLDQVLISKEKDFDRSWLKQSRDISRKLWLPIKIDYVGSGFNLSKPYFLSTVEKSWFSIEKILPLKKNSSLISFPSSLLSPEEYMDSEVVKYVKLSKDKLKIKNLKFRIFLTKEEKQQFKLDSEIWRWYYNFIVDLYIQEKFDAFITYNKVNYPKIRDEVRKYGCLPVGSTNDKIRLEEIIPKDNLGFYIPPFFPTPHNRIIRGAIRKFTGNLRSAISNKYNGNIYHFKMGFRRKKKGEYISFEDGNFPMNYKRVKAYYGYRTKDHKRKSIKPYDVAKNIGWKGCTFYQDKNSGYYYMLYPVPIDYYPSCDRRIENQGSKITGKVIVLDPGVRKFLVGYSPQQEILIVDRSKIITRLLLDIDKTKNQKEKRVKWNVIKNYIDDLHWKTIRYLVNHYDVIVLGDISIKSILKGKIYRMTKRVLSQYSFYKFKQRLNWICHRTGKTCLFVDESYTSKACCKCGKINNVGSSEKYKCNKCENKIDRDINGAMNILIKTIANKRG